MNCCTHLIPGFQSQGFGDEGTPFRWNFQPLGTPQIIENFTEVYIIPKPIITRSPIHLYSLQCWRDPICWQGWLALARRLQVFDQVHHGSGKGHWVNPRMARLAGSGIRGSEFWFWCFQHWLKPLSISKKWLKGLKFPMPKKTTKSMICYYNQVARRPSSPTFLCIAAYQQDKHISGTFWWCSSWHHPEAFAVSPCPTCEWLGSLRNRNGVSPWQPRSEPSTTWHSSPELLS